MVLHLLEPIGILTMKMDIFRYMDNLKHLDMISHILLKHKERSRRNRNY